MRYVFMDEAGTSAKEPVTVVVGIIADADQHVLTAEALAIEAQGAIPEPYREGFVFHATDVFGAKKYQGDWSPTQRLRLLTNMMAIPKKVGMAVVLSTIWRGALDHSGNLEKLGMRPEQADHFHAFQQCVCVADRSIRWYGGASEVGSIVAEDVPEMRKFLKHIPRISRMRPFNYSPAFLRETVKDQEAGYLTQDGEMRVTRIRNAVHFVEKDADPLVQIADACAFGFRRFFAGEKMGVEFARAILGSETKLRSFAPPGGAECWWPA